MANSEHALDVMRSLEDEVTRLRLALSLVRPVLAEIEDDANSIDGSDRSRDYATLVHNTQANAQKGLAILYSADVKPADLATQLRSCPCCRSASLVPAAPAFVEIGEYNGSSYMEEGSVDTWRCTLCQYAYADMSGFTLDTNAEAREEEEFV